MSRALATAFGTIRDRLATAAGTTLPGAPVTLGWWNVPFDPPAPGNGVLWLRAAILGGAGEPVTIEPDATNEVRGIFQIDAYVPENEGMGDAETLLDAVATLYDRQNLDPIFFDVAGAPRPTPSDAGGWQRLTLSIPFFVIETT